jgi:hypothetical protein
MKKELNIKAILIGFATMMGLAILGGVGIASVSQFIPPRSFPNDLRLFLLFLGIICDFSGGFVTGWIAKHDRVKNAFALAVLNLIFSQAIKLISGSGPISSVLVGIVRAVLATLCGGYLAKVASERKSLQEG